VDLRDKYDNSVSTSSASLYYALLSYETAGIYAHSATSYASSSAGITLGASLLTFSFSPSVSSSRTVDIICGLLGTTGGLFGTYYEDANMKYPVFSDVAATVDFSDSGSSATRWPAAPYFLDNLQVVARWQGMITPASTGTYTFEVLVDGSDDRVRLWVSNAQLLNFWVDNSTIKTAKCCSVANSIDVAAFSLLVGDPVVFSGVVPSGITPGTVYYVFNPTSVTFQIRAAASSGTAIALTATPHYFFGYSALVYRATVQFPATDIRYPITVHYFHYANSKKMQLKWIAPAGSSVVVPTSALSRIDPFPRFPYQVSIKPLAFCSATSVLSGNGLSLATHALASTFSITARDRFQNIVTDPDLRFVAAARPSSPANLPASFASIESIGMGVFRATLIPKWSAATNIQLAGRPDQQCPAADGGLSIGTIETGLFATYYRGTYSASLDTSAMDIVYVTPLSDLPGIPLGVSAVSGFVARFRGIISAPFAGTYTFAVVAQGNSNGEMSRLTIGTSVVIATTVVSVCVAGSCSFSGTVAMDVDTMFDIVVDFQDSRPAIRPLALQWTMSPFFNANTVPSSAFVRESCNSAFTAANQPAGGNAFQCAKGVAALTVASGTAVTLVTAGSAATFSVTVKDSFGSVRGTTSNADLVFCNGTTGSSSTGTSHGWATTAAAVTDGVYSCSFTTTRSGTYTVYNQVFRPGGLMGNYYGNYLFFGQPVSSSVSLVNFNWTSATSGVAALSFVAAKYVGLVRPAYTGTYQVQVCANAGDEIALWIDGQLRLNASTLRQSPNATDSLAFGTSFVCTFAMAANTYYDIRLEYKDFGGPSFLQLQWQSSLQAPQLIPSSRLFWAVTTASFSTQVVKSSSTLSTISVGVNPAPLLAQVYGDAITASTSPTHPSQQHPFCVLNITRLQAPPESQPPSRLYHATRFPTFEIQQTRPAAGWRWLSLIPVRLRPHWLFPPSLGSMPSRVTGECTRQLSQVICRFKFLEVWLAGSSRRITLICFS
jgi:hypothetical protein